GRIESRFPEAAWFEYEAADDDSGIEGSRIAFGSPAREMHALESARVVVTFDRDFLGTDGDIAEQRGFAKGRYTPGPGGTAKGSSMSRLYVVESGMTLTGGQADHRLARKPSYIAGMVAYLAQSVL